MKCNDILNRNMEENYRRDCEESVCPYVFTPESCRFLYTGKVKVREMLNKIKIIVDEQYIDLHNDISDYDTNLIQILATISQTIEKGLEGL